MRLWSIHPCYLDARGIVALWRESLLAQAVFANQTKGYTQHPQLIRWRNALNPLQAIQTYLWNIYKESVRRGYLFNPTKIHPPKFPVSMQVTDGQLAYERIHLLHKLRMRNTAVYKQFFTYTVWRPHPMFTIVEGPIEEWEKNILYTA